MGTSACSMSWKTDVLVRDGDSEVSRGTGTPPAHIGLTAIREIAAIREDRSDDDRGRRNEFCCDAA